MSSAPAPPAPALGPPCVPSSALAPELRRSLGQRFAEALCGRVLTPVQCEIAGQLLALLLAAAVGVGLTAINFTYLGYSGDVVDIGSWGAFFTAYATLFAIIAGLVLVNTLNRFNGLATALEDELNAVESIRDSIVHLMLTPEQEAEVLLSLEQYLVSVSAVEWQLMARQGEPGSAQPIDSDTSLELHNIHQVLAGVQRAPMQIMSAHLPAGSDPDAGSNDVRHLRRYRYRDSLLVNVIIPTVLELGRLRTNRISLSTAQLPPRIKLLLVWMMYFLVIGFILLSVQNVWINIFMTIAVSTAIQWLYTIISDLDHPFFGIWNLSQDQLLELIAKFQNARRDAAAAAKIPAADNNAGRQQSGSASRPIEADGVAGGDSATAGAHIGRFQRIRHRWQEAVHSQPVAREAGSGAVILEHAMLPQPQRQHTILRRAGTGAGTGAGGIGGTDADQPVLQMQVEVTSDADSAPASASGWHGALPGQHSVLTSV